MWISLSEFSVLFHWYTCLFLRPLEVGSIVLGMLAVSLNILYDHGNFHHLLNDEYSNVFLFQNNLN